MIFGISANFRPPLLTDERRLGTEEPHLNTKLVSYIDVAFDHIGLNADAALFDEMMGACAVFAQHRQFDRFVRFDSELTRTNYTGHNLNAWCLSI